MKAVVCKTYGPSESLGYGEFPKPTIKSNEVLIQVEACGINFPDTLIIQGKYQFRPDPPFVPGGEVCGTVTACGDAVDSIKKGDRVMAKLTWGGLAEYAACDQKSVYKIPDNMERLDAAALLMTYATSYHALVDRAEAKNGEVALVLGAAGGIGIATIQIAKALGMKVIAAASSQEKLDICIAQGADHPINYLEADLKSEVKRLTKGAGVDVIMDPVGGQFSEPAFRAIARYGRHLVVGFTDGEISKIPLNLPLLKSASMVGVFWSSFCQNEPDKNRENVDQLLKWYASGKIKPLISKTYSLEEGAKAISVLEKRQAAGKVVVSIA